MLLLMVYVPLFPYIYNGPFWNEKGAEPDECRHWYFNILYINNFQTNLTEGVRIGAYTVENKYISTDTCFS